MIRKLMAMTLVGAFVGTLALAVFGRLQAPVERTVQLPADFALRSLNVRDLFPRSAGSDGWETRNSLMDWGRLK